MKHIGRKLYHLFGGLGLLGLYYLLGRHYALICYSILFLLVLTIDLARLRIPAFNQLIFTRFGSFIREGERYKLTGTAPYVLGIAVSLYAFSLEIATAAICFLAFGDVSATTVGERYGRTKIGEKSLEGTIAFAAAALLSALLLSAIGVHLMARVMILGAVVAAVVELLPLPINDNLAIPLIAGGAMELALRLFG